MYKKLDPEQLFDIIKGKIPLKRKVEIFCKNCGKGRKVYKSVSSWSKYCGRECAKMRWKL